MLCGTCHRPSCVSRTLQPVVWPTVFLVVVVCPPSLPCHTSLCPAPVDMKIYTGLYEPAFDWIFQCLAHRCSEVCVHVPIGVCMCVCMCVRCVQSECCSQLVNGTTRFVWAVEPLPCSCAGVGVCSDLLCWQYLRGFCGAAVVCVCGVGSHGSVCSSVVWLCVSGGVGCVEW